MVLNWQAMNVSAFPLSGVTWSKLKVVFRLYQNLDFPMTTVFWEHKDNWKEPLILAFLPQTEEYERWHAPVNVEQVFSLGTALFWDSDYLSVELSGKPECFHQFLLQISFSLDWLF